MRVIVLSGGADAQTPHLKLWSRAKGTSLMWVMVEMQIQGLS